MADIQFYQEDNDETQEEDDAGLGLDDVEDYGDSYNPDEGLTPLQKLEKYMESENFYNRQMVARSLLEVMRMVADTDEDPNVVLKAMVKLSEDPESGVRTELMEQVPHIAMYCQEYREQFDKPISQYILPIIVKYLLDSNNQVRKTSQAAMLVLLEQGLIDKVDVEEHICPVIMDLTSPDSMDDFRTEAVALMSKMAPLVGKDITCKIFLPRFAEMCTDALFHVRKVCAANFGDMCAVVGQDNTESILLSKFYYLCEDGVWGVRKACAECFMQVSCSSSQEVRRTQLAQLFISLICDQSRWVRMAAFQALGAFISTFADPNITGLFFNEEGVLMVGSPEEGTKRFVISECEKSSLLASLKKELTDVPSTVVSQKPSANVDNREVEDMEIDVDNIELLDSKSQGAKSSVSKEDAESVRHDGSPSEPEGQDKDTCRLTENKNVSSNTDSEETVEPTETNSSPSKCEAEVQISNDSVEKSDNKCPDNQSFNDFEYWRPPLPVIDIVEDTSISSQVEEKNTEVRLEEVEIKDSNVDLSDVTLQLEDSHIGDDTEKSVEEEIASLESALESGFESKVTETQTSSSDQTSSDDDDYDEESPNTEIRIHTANVITADTPAEEEVANIGSMHVLGQQVDQRTMTIVDGVVQGTQDARLLRDLSSVNYSLDDSPLNSHDASRDDSYNLDDPAYEQDVIPQALLEHYLSMTEPSRAQTVDSEIAKHCAYSLPAVAYTLGRRYWPCLKVLYDTLASDMQWKVRRTLAFSIHELAMIVGTEITCRDLAPIFNGFLKDLDEVRIGVLKHLSDFLKLLTPDYRSDYLAKIQEFLTTDNSRNWRFREELAIQLTMVLHMYTPKEISEHLVPIALVLAEDRVYQVRRTSFQVLSCMLKRLNESDDPQMPLIFINDLLERFAQSDQANKRQMFAHICCSILEEEALNQERIAKDLLPSLLGLSNDKVPNVRITLGKLLSTYVLSSDYFTSPNNPHHEDLLKTIQILQSDPDRDVRWFVTSHAPSETSLVGEPDTIPV